MTRVRSAVLPLALSALVLTMGATVRAQHAETPEAVAPPANSPSSKTTAGESEPTHTSPPKPAASTATAPATAARPATQPKPPNVQTVVERIQERIDTELGPQSATTKSKTTPKGVAMPRQRAAAAPTLGPGRIHLNWRASLIWPDELLHPSPMTAPATVVWP